MTSASNILRSALVSAFGPFVRRARGVSDDSFEVQYLGLLRNVLANGTLQSNRTSKRAISLHGAYLRFDVSKGFPALTTKKLAFKSVIGELIGFLRAKTSAADFRALNCKVWDQNANENEEWLANPHRAGVDDLGPVYGYQWRRWPAYKSLDLDCERADERMAAMKAQGYKLLTVVEGMDDELGKTSTAILAKEYDQLRKCLDTIISNPTDRRILFHGWNPAELDAIALPACHILKVFSVNVEKRELSMSCTMRSCDVGLGLPFNAASEAALLSLVARLTGYTPKWLSMSLADAHIYENQLEMVQEQLRRIPMKAPQFTISGRVPEFSKTGRYEPEWLERVEPSDFALEGYEHHAPLTAAMAV
jgi:thymidylate synthase